MTNFFQVFYSSLSSLIIRRLLELRRRFEPPNDKNRWDSPLFKVFNTVDVIDGHNESSLIASTAADLSHSTSKSDDDAIQTDPNSALNSSSLNSQTSISSPLANTNPIQITANANIKASSSCWKPRKKLLLDQLPLPSQPSVLQTTSDPVTSASVSTETSAAMLQFQKLTISGSVVSGDSNVESLTFTEAFDRIITFFDSASAPTPLASTAPVAHASADLLYDLDRVTQQIVKLIIENQNEAISGTPIILKDFERSITLHRFIGVNELQRIRRQFIKASGSIDKLNSACIGVSFIEYLTSNI